MFDSIMDNASSDTMANAKLIAVLAVAIIAIAGVAGYVLLKDNGNNNDRPESLTDAAGNVIDLKKTYSKVASTTAVGTEIVCDLGMKSSLVAVTNSAHIYEMTQKVNGVNLTFDYPTTIPQDIADGKLMVLKYNWTAEQVAEAKADLVIIDHNVVAADDSKMKQLQTLGITCLVLYEENTWDKINENYSMLGKVFDKTSRADEINKAALDADKKVMDKFKAQNGKNIAYICYCYNTYYIYNQSGLMDAALRMGCTNVMPTTTTTTITPEQIAAKNIDFIFFDDMGTSLNWEEVIAGWKADPVMGQIDAIKNGRFACMEATPFQATSYPTIHYVMGEGLVGSMIYPDVAGITLPNIVTADKYVDYLSWLDA